MPGLNSGFAIVTLMFLSFMASDGAGAATMSANRAAAAITSRNFFMRVLLPGKYESEKIRFLILHNRDRPHTRAARALLGYILHSFSRWFHSRVFYFCIFIIAWKRLSSLAKSKFFARLMTSLRSKLLTSSINSFV